MVPESLRTRVAAEAPQFSFFWSVAIGQPSRSEVQSLLAQAQFAMSPQAEDFRGSAASEKKFFFFFGGVKLEKMTELNYDVAFCCISYYMFLLELFSRNCKNTEDRILISLFGRFRDCLSLLKPPEGYSKSVPINV